MAVRMFLAMIRQEGEGYVAECADTGRVGRGATPQEALAQLKEATLPVAAERQAGTPPDRDGSPASLDAQAIPAATSRG